MGRTMSNRVRISLIILAFAIVVVVCGASSFVLVSTSYRLILEDRICIAGKIRIENFTLCQMNYMSGSPQPLSSSILTPTAAVTACGYMDVDPSCSVPDLCLAYEVLRGSESVFRPYTRYCMPWHSQYFSFPVESRELLVPGIYELYAYPDAARDQPASVFFEIRPSSK
jgi:hypothetical protein